MSYTAGEVKEAECKCQRAVQEALEKMEARVSEMHANTAKLLKDREEKERKWSEQLQETVSEQIGKSLAGICEGVVQKELRGHVLSKLEKTLSMRLEQKLGELANVYAATVAASLENKSLHGTLTKALKTGIVDAVIPVIENGMTELRLQMMEQIGQIMESLARLDDENPSLDSKDETLDHITNSLKNLHYSENTLLEDSHEMVMHLLETNILECFTYVVHSSNPDTLLFLLSQLPVDAEVNLPNNVLISFIEQLISIITTIDKQHTPDRLKHILLLNNALSQVQTQTFAKEEYLQLEKSFGLLRNDPEFGHAPEDVETFTIMRRIQL